MPPPPAFEADHESRYADLLLLSADERPSIQPPDDPPPPLDPSSLPPTDVPPSNLRTNPLLLLLIVGATTSESNPAAAPFPPRALSISPLSELDPCCLLSGSLSLSPLSRLDRLRHCHSRVKSDCGSSLGSLGLSTLRVRSVPPPASPQALLVFLYSSGSTIQGSPPLRLSAFFFSLFTLQSFEVQNPWTGSARPTVLKELG